jgi:hypothetical protein
MAVAYEDQTIMAVIAAVPLWIGNSEQRTLLWRTVDIATRPAGRGKGLFVKLLSALLKDMPTGEILAGFPNSNSTPGFKRIGCEESQYAATWVRPVLPGWGAYNTGSRVDRLAVEDTDVLRRLLISDTANSFIRDVDYLNWRYSDHPSHDYHIHFLDRGNGDAGLIIFRESEIYRRKILLILEMWPSNENIRTELLRLASKYCRSRGVHMMLTVNSVMGTLTGLRHRFIAIPRSIVPKQQVLRGTASGDTAPHMLRSKWNIQMGDLLEF